MMQAVINLLKESPAVYLGTVTPEGKPKVRPFALLFEREGTLFFCTSRKTSAYRDLKNHPYTEISVMSSEYRWVRISAKVVFSDDQKIKEVAIKENERLQHLFGSADNPDFEIFFLAEGTATLHDFSENPVQIFTF